MSHMCIYNTYAVVFYTLHMVLFLRCTRNVPPFDMCMFSPLSGFRFILDGSLISVVAAALAVLLLLVVVVVVVVVVV